jgi:hypothetical protein
MERGHYADCLQVDSEALREAEDENNNNSKTKIAAIYSIN